MTLASTLTRRSPRPAPSPGSRASTGLRSRDHDPRQAAAPTGVLPLRLKEHALAVIGRAFPGAIEDCRRRALRCADERRTDHPSAADHHECRAARAFRALGHPQGGHAAGSAPRHRRARCRTHRGPRSARLRCPALPARRSLCARGRGVDVRPRFARQAHRLGRLARAHRADAASLHARGRADGALVPNLVRRARGRADAARARVSLDRRRDLQRKLHGERTHAAEPRARRR